jgi:transcriptional regulator with XRE-family HTH domain
MSRPSDITPAAAQERELAKAFVERVRQLREAKSLSLLQLARKAGISESWLTKVETQPRSITLPLIQRLCTGLEVDPNELLNGLPVLTETARRANRTRRVSV